MGWTFRKQKKLGPITVGVRGTRPSVSVGAGGLRYRIGGGRRASKKQDDEDPPGCGCGSCLISLLVMVGLLFGVVALGEYLRVNYLEKPAGAEAAPAEVR